MFTKIATSTLIEIRQELEKLAALEDRVEALSAETSVYRDVLELVATGSMDAAVALDKVAGFIENPNELNILRAAYNLSGGLRKIGSVTEDEDSLSGSAKNPESKLKERLSKIVDNSHSW